MRAWLPLVALLGVACPHKEVRDKGFVPASTTADVLSASLAPRRLALVIGVQDYHDPAFPDLHHAVDDARDLGAALERGAGGGYDEVRYLLDPDRQEVLDALRRLRGELRREDSLVVYFSGHGTRVLDGSTWRRFLLAADARPGDLEGTAIDLETLQTYFSGLPPARKALVLDACFSGDGKSVVRPSSLDPDELPEAPPLVGVAGLGPGEAHLYATSPGRPSREDDALGHGVYTHYLLDALSWSSRTADLDGDGLITAWEAHDHARSRTLEHTHGAQVPEAALRVVGMADVILAGDPQARARRETALVYLYPTQGDAWAGARVLVDGRDKGALPGTVAVRPGRHHVVLQGEGEGEERLVDGWVTLQADRAYRVDDLARVAQGPRRALAVRGLGLASPPLSVALGDGAAGVELWGALRANRGPQRGLYGEAALGYAMAPEREHTSNARPVLTLSGAGGYQSDWRRLRYRGGWGLTGAWLPVDWVSGKPTGEIDPREHPTEAGWVLWATGPTVGLGVALSDGWALTLSGRAHVAWLQVEPDQARAVPWYSVGIGPEVSW